MRRFHCSVPVLAGAWALLLTAAPVHAVDVPIACKLAKVRASVPLTRIICVYPKPVFFPVPVPGSGDDPTLVGATIEVFDAGAEGGPGTFNILPSGFIGLGNPPGSNGYAANVAVCNNVRIKPRVIKVLCHEDLVLSGGQSHPLDGPLGFRLTTGSLRYCASFGGSPIQNNSDFFFRKDAAAPGACP